MKLATFPSQLAALILAASLPAVSVLRATGAGEPTRRVVTKGVVAVQRLSVKESASRSVFCVALTQDEKTIALSDGEEIHVWDLLTGRHPRLSFKAFYISSMAFTRDGRQLLTSSHAMEGGLTSYAATSGRVLYQLSPAKRDWQSVNPQEVAIAPEGLTLASCHHTDLRFWDLKARQEQKERRITPDPHPRIVCLAYSADGKLIAGGTSRPRRRDGKTPGTRAFVWDSASGEMLLSAVSGHDDAIETCAFSGDGCLLLCSGHYSVPKDRFGRPRDDETDDYLSHRLWEIASGKVIFEQERTEPPRTPTIAISADGRLFASVGESGSIVLRDTVDGSLVHEFEPVDASPQWYHFTTDRKMLLTVHFMNGGPVLYAWDLTSLPKARADKPRPPVAALWADLASSEVRPARRAVRDLTEQPDRAVPFLAKQLRPVPGADDRTIERLISDLDSFRFPIRQTAENRLELLARRALPALKKAAANPASIQHGRIIDDLLRRIGPPYTSSERLRRLRAIEALEHIGSSDAQNVLIVVASGAAQVPETEAAKASLARLAAWKTIRP